MIERLLSADRGRTASLTATSVDRVQDGQIAEHWLELDFTGFMQKLLESNE